MKRRHALLGVGTVLALALTVPALGGPSNPIAESAVSLTKIKKKANLALTTANNAQSAASNAQTGANNALGAATNALATAQGKQDRIRWAFVTSAGSITAQSGGISITDTMGSEIYVNFGSSQANRALIATPFWTDNSGNAHVTALLCGGTGNPGGGTCSGVVNNTNHVFVETESPPGTSDPNGFWLASIP
jgi:hypothetical protein